MLSWLAPQIRIDGLMPKLFNALPVLDLTVIEEVADLMGLGFACSNGLVTNVVVQLKIVEFVTFLNRNRMRNDY